MATPDFGERTQQDFRQWSKLDGIYYEKHKTKAGEMRTWRVSFNPFAGKYQIHQPTNWVAAEPTPEMKAWSPQISAAITRTQPVSERGFY